MRYLLLVFALVAMAFNNSNSEVRQKIKEYEEAFNRHDAKALANLWAENAVWTHPRTGSVLKGRKEIEGRYQKQFDEWGNARVDNQVQSLEFPSETKAIALGLATVTTSKTPLLKLNYRAVFEKNGEGWQLVALSDAAERAAPSHYEHLKDLEWLVGDWVDEDSNTKIETKGSWDPYKNFILQDFTVTVLNQVELKGKQIIGWDPIAKQIQSWVFDSDGGRGTGTWSKQKDNWVVESLFISPDGKKGSSTNVYSKITPQSYTWESQGREIQGEMLPNLSPVTVHRRGQP